MAHLTGQRPSEAVTLGGDGESRIAATHRRDRRIRIGDDIGDAAIDGAHEAGNESGLVPHEPPRHHQRAAVELGDERPVVKEAHAASTG